jgi:hypothetical protein
MYILQQVLWLAPTVLVSMVFLALYPALKHANNRPRLRHPWLDRPA